MATAMMPRALIIFLIIVPLSMSSEARVYPKFSSMMMSTKKVSSEVLLRDMIKYIGRNNSEYIHNKRSMLGNQLERVAPSGPDAHHH